MPRFSYDGARIAAGIAGGTVSVGHVADQMHVVASKAGGAVWLGNEVLYQHCQVVAGKEACRIDAFDATTCI